MSENPTFVNTRYDQEAGCEYREVLQEKGAGKVRLCYVRVSDIRKIAEELTRYVQDTSWMAELDKGTKRSYEHTVAETTKALVRIFKETVKNNAVAGEFGELMVSMSSARALNVIFEHSIIPLAELWKPQLRQNEGFDFHTVCKEEFINFGEAKFSSSASPHGKAISKAASFIEEEKHFRDRVHLISLVKQEAINNLDNDDFGVVAAFSINANNPLTVLNHANVAAQIAFSSDSIKKVYLVGVVH